MQDIARRTQQDLEASTEKQASPRESLETAQAVMLRETTASEGDDVGLGADLFSVGATSPRRLTRWQRVRNWLRQLWRCCTRLKRTGNDASADELNMALGQNPSSSVVAQSESEDYCLETRSLVAGMTTLVVIEPGCASQFN